MNTRVGWKTITVLAIAVIAMAAQAEVVDLTTAGSVGDIGAGLFFQWDGQSTGTGVIDSFAEIGGNTDVVEGYNTTVNGTLDNGSSDNFNHELLLSDIPIVNIGGINYREFLLDVNQTGSSPLLSLDELQVFTSDTPNQSTETFSGDIIQLADATLIYNIDAIEDSYILLNYSLNSGSGGGDMLFYLPDSLFSTGDQYVYLYSLFGENNANNDGFEEWAVQEGGTDVIPEPMTLSLVGVGLAGLALRRRITR